MLIQALVIAILGIFEAYLALGLIVGICGIMWSPFVPCPSGVGPASYEPLDTARV